MKEKPNSKNNPNVKEITNPNLLKDNIEHFNKNLMDII